MPNNSIYSYSVDKELIISSTVASEGIIYSPLGFTTSPLSRYFTSSSLRFVPFLLSEAKSTFNVLSFI